ncbi:MAG: 50S ribosomal protein L25/general stress protein Ctc [Chlorobi bacterium]|nr:50S ribosomal protein L25/general stress protein Ctc [Chlorobiota bacterium]
MKSIEIKGFKRETLGKKATKQLRKDGNVPCVLYGGEEIVHFYAPVNEFRHLFYTPNVYTVNINVDGKVYPTILKDAQFHPVSESPLHVDFLHIQDDKPVTIDIPVKIEGFAKGVQAGGILRTEKRKLTVRGLPKHLPDELVINVDDLDLGKTIKVGDLNFDNLELLNAKNAVVVAVRLTRAARAAQQAAQQQS